ncbi:DUF423 domain-containing protein [Flectobacillus longus]|uniref:DUF423 domain-containing protein n=1 Tax=Flectobacillus longus TaxID=2984207 RepID=UPI0024B66266|nr:DUF423 domain-containing protein [Flectobacillus longus]MDI9880344.1 DUF423 domain-containing protein [Flectobacillus longus]
MNKFFLQIGAVLAALSVALGAFGAHAFKASLEAMGRTETFETAARYQMYGALGLLAIGILSATFKHAFVRYAGNALLVGTIIFAGALYMICATGVTMWGAVAPIGGTCLMVGWVLLALGITKSK